MSRDLPHPLACVRTDQFKFAYAGPVVFKYHRSLWHLYGKMWYPIDYSLEKGNDRHGLTIEDVISKIVYWNGFLIMYD